MSRRTPETLVDWLVVGIAPFLIMLLVGSLVFYLVEVFYLGDYPLRLLWVLGLFVMAIVCVARISMEEGAAYASMYAVPLAGAVGLALTVFVEVKGPLAVLGPLLNWILMGIVWWSAHKLTWDCTLIEGGRDFTGQGLMQTTGLDRFFRVKTAETTSASTEPQPAPDLSGTSSSTPVAALPVWKWWQSEARPHAPGVWVVYFSIAALPLFGLGQWFMPTDGLDLRRRAFWLLVIYVVAGLSLLMATSFLSLRRYLRQRNLEMPGEMAAVWLGTGGAMIFILLLLASFLPRPIPEYSITHLAPQIKSPELNPSRWGWGQEGTKPKPGAAETATKGEPAQHGQKTGPDGKPVPNAQGEDRTNSSSGSPSKNGQSSAGNSENKSQSNNSDSKQNSEQGKSSQSNDPSKSSSDSNDQSAANKSQPPPENKTNPPRESSPQNNPQSPPKNSNNEPSNNSPLPDNPPAEQQPTPPLPNETQVPPPTNYLAQAMNQVFAYLAHALKWLFYLLVIAVIAYFAWQHRERLLNAWQQLMRELRALWNKWFGSRPVAEVTVVPVTTAPPPKRFAEYADPFATGLAARWSLAELVRYTFEALEARGREKNCPRSNDQTPLEYAAAVGQLEPAFASEFRSLADLYGQLAFARGTASPQSTSLLQQLWQRWK